MSSEGDKGDRWFYLLGVVLITQDGDDLLVLTVLCYTYVKENRCEIPLLPVGLTNEKVCQ